MHVITPYTLNFVNIHNAGSPDQIKECWQEFGGPFYMVMPCWSWSIRAIGWVRSLRNASLKAVKNVWHSRVGPASCLNTDLSEGIPEFIIFSIRDKIGLWSLQTTGGFIHSIFSHLFQVVPEDREACEHFWQRLKGHPPVIFKVSLLIDSTKVFGYKRFFSSFFSLQPTHMGMFPKVGSKAPDGRRLAEHRQWQTPSLDF